MRKVQRRCCLNYWVSRERSDPEHTYSLRYKRSTDDASTGWSDPITLTFSGSTAVALTGLDPGTVYDVSVEAEGAEFISQPASEVSYAGTLTVGSDLVWTLRNSSGVGKGIDKSVVQSGRDFPYIRVGGGQ